MNQSIIQKETERKSFPREVIHGVQGGGGGLKGKTTLKVKEKTTVIMAVPLLFGIWGSGRDKKRERDWKMKGVTVIRPGTGNQDF